MNEDLLTEFEAIEPKWEWHDTLSFILLFPILLIILFLKHLIKTEQP
jgi:hypothetical protein